MKRKLLVILAILVMACSATVASADTLFYIIPDVNTATVGPGPFAWFSVTAENSAATFTFSTLANPSINFTPGGTYFMIDAGGSTIGLNFSQTGVVLSNFTGVTGNVNPLIFANVPGGAHIDGYGDFNSAATITNFNGFPSRYQTVTFTATGATNFANAAAVLTNNALGNLVAIHISNTSGITGDADHAQLVPIPPTALLLGSGLLGLGLIGWRRKK